MGRMTAQQMMGGFECRPNTGAPKQMEPSGGRVGPLPPGSGSKDFVMDMDGDQDKDVRASSTGRKDLGEGPGETDGTSLSAKYPQGNRHPMGQYK